MREAFAEQRALHRDRIAAAQARLATQRRLHEQQRTAALLQRAWERLPGELAQRWRDPAARAAWVAMVIGRGEGAHAARAVAHRACARLAGGRTTGAAGRAGRLEPDAAPVFEADARIRAGLKVAAGGNLIDGTLDGLLADRGDLESRLLRQLESATAEDAAASRIGEEPMSLAIVRWIAGPVLHAVKQGPFSLRESVRVGPQALLGEVVRIHDDQIVVQVYEDTTGLRPGIEVHGDGQPLAIRLGPGAAGAHLRRPAAPVVGHGFGLRAAGHAHGGRDCAATSSRACASVRCWRRVR